MKTLIKLLYKISGFSGLFWFATDIFWYWKMNLIAFIIGSISVILFIVPLFREHNKTYQNILILLNLWLGINMIALAKDVFMISENTVLVLNYVVGLATSFSIGLIVALIQNKTDWKHFKRL